LTNIFGKKENQTNFDETKYRRKMNSAVLGRKRQKAFEGLVVSEALQMPERCL